MHDPLTIFAIKNSSYVVRCTIWYHLYNLKNVKSTHGGVLLLVNCTPMPKCDFKASHIYLIGS